MSRSSRILSSQLKGRAQRHAGNTRPAAITVAFFNDDVCSHASNSRRLWIRSSEHPRQVVVEGICRHRATVADIRPSRR